MRRSTRTLFLGALLALSFGLAACGGEDDGGGGEQGASTGAPVEGKQGGKMTMLWTADVDNIDPGVTYYTMGSMIVEATQKKLYGFKPDDSERQVPDLAEGDPQVSEDAKTVTVKIKPGVKFSAPVNREVTSKDVKYAIERGFFNTVNNGYAGAYFGDLEGAKEGVKPGTKISGIETPDDQTVVLKLSKPTGGIYQTGALSMPITAPVPEEYAREFDRKNPSTYGQNQVATGPYMVENNAEGKAIGYEPGRRIRLVRNPNWDKSLDYKPAYLDEIDMPQGNEDTAVASRRILDGQSLTNGEFAVPPASLKQAATRQKDQLTLVPAGGGRWISMNTKLKPFDDVNVRKAVAAGFNRNALRLARGGELIGDIPTHVIPPNVPGFDEAGGQKGPGVDFMSKPEGDPALSAEYFKKAGFASGKYEGGDELLMVSGNDPVQRQVAEVAKENFERLGFKVRLRPVLQNTMYTKFCGVPKAKVAICPSVGWFKDFPDGQAILDPTFNGENILQQNNVAWSQLDVPEINKAMNDARLLTDPTERAEAWAKVDQMVTEQAPAIFFTWDKEPMIASKNVNNVVSKDHTQVSIPFTSLK